MATEPRFLLDSNICIDLLEGLSPTARARVEQCRPGEVVASAITCAEVMRGVDPDDFAAAAKVNALWTHVPVVPFDERAALVFGQLRGSRGRFDVLIAAHARSLELTLVTNNERDFRGIAGLRVENWTLAS